MTTTSEAKAEAKTEAKTEADKSKTEIKTETETETETETTTVKTSHYHHWKPYDDPKRVIVYECSVCGVRFTQKQGVHKG